MLDLVAANPIDLFLQYGFYRRAVIAALLVAVVAGALGIHVVLRGLSLIGDGLGHIGLAGVAIGLVVGIWPLGFALVAAVLGALTIQLLQAKNVVKGDTAIGILFTAGLGIAVLLLSSGPGFGPSADAFLFGNLLSVGPTDLYVVAVLAAGILLFLTLAGKELFATTLNAEDARLSGVPVFWVELGFTLATAASVVVAVRVVGALLVSGLLIVPAAASLQLARSFQAALLGSVAIGVAAVLLGIWWATAAGVATGAAIAVASVGLFAAATLVARRPRRTA